MICDGDSSAYEAVKYIYMIADNDEQEQDQESKDTDDGVVQQKAMFPSIHIVIIMYFELLFQKCKSIKKIILL